MDATEADELDRLTLLEELVDSLRPIVNSAHSEHGLQGLGGLIGQYQKALADIETLRAAKAKREETTFDQIATRRADKAASGSAGAARRRV